jgi:hypothetical protein
MMRYELDSRVQLITICDATKKNTKRVIVGLHMWMIEEM